MEDPQLHGIIGAGKQVAQGGFGDTAFDKQLVLGHTLLSKKFFDPQAHCLVQLHIQPPFRDSMVVLYEILRNN